MHIALFKEVFVNGANLLALKIRSSEATILVEGAYNRKAHNGKVDVFVGNISTWWPFWKGSVFDWCSVRVSLSVWVMSDHLRLRYSLACRKPKMLIYKQTTAFFTQQGSIETVEVCILRYVWRMLIVICKWERHPSPCMRYMSLQTSGKNRSDVVSLEPFSMCHRWIPHEYAFKVLWDTYCNLLEQKYCRVNDNAGSDEQAYWVLKCWKEDMPDGYECCVELR